MGGLLVLVLRLSLGKPLVRATHFKETGTGSAWTCIPNRGARSQLLALITSRPGDTR